MSNQVMTSYVWSCSAKVGRFCDLSHMGELSYVPAYELEYVFHASLMVFMGAHIHLNQGGGHTRSRFIGAVF